MASTKKKTAKEYAKELRNKYPELYKSLLDQAQWVLRSSNNKYTPKDLKKQLDLRFNNLPDLNPRTSLDTFGVRSFIDLIAKSPEEASQAKRLYNNTIDAWIKQIYKNKLDKLKDKDDNLKEYIDSVVKEYFE